MKLFNKKHIGIACIVSLFSIQVYYAQIGIGTVTPEGALDLRTNDFGLIFPRVPLTAKNVQAPVVNPSGGPIVKGTVVYNTNLSHNGANDVVPGIYAWDGSQWNPQFLMKDYAKFEQDSGCLRVDTNNDESEEDFIDGLVNKTFIPKYSGIYSIKVNTNYGAGEMTNFYSGNEISLSTAEGSFYFSLSGLGVNIDPNPGGYAYDYTEGWIYTHSYSTYNELENPDIKDTKDMHYSTVTYHKYLTAGTPYNFTLSLSIITGEGFLNNGDSGEGMGHVGHDIPCSVEFTFKE